MSKCMELLAIATTAIRDHYLGFPEDEIVAPYGNGMRSLLRDLAQYLRENGVDDDGAWDCDVTEGIEVSRMPDFKPFLLVVEAYACDDFGDGLAYAEATVDRAFIEQLFRLSAVCRGNGLESVTVSQGPDRWDNQNDLRICGDSLRVFGDSVWYEAHPKHADYNVETRIIEINDLVRIAKMGPGADTSNDSFRWSSGTLFYAGDPGYLPDLIDMVEQEKNEPEPCFP